MQESKLIVMKEREKILRAGSVATLKIDSYWMQHALTQTKSFNARNNQIKYYFEQLFCNLFHWYRLQQLDLYDSL